MFLRHFIFRRVVTETCTHFSIFHTNRMYIPLLNAIRRFFAKTRYRGWILASVRKALLLIAFLQKHPKNSQNPSQAASLLDSGVNLIAPLVESSFFKNQL